MLTQTQQFTVNQIGVVHCHLMTKSEAPKNYSESTETGSLVLYPEYRDGLKGIKAGETIMVLFWLHKAERDLLQVYPRGDKGRGLQGIFSTRSPMRPNPIAVSELKVLAIKDLTIDVAGLDVINGTPILDIKRSLAEEGKKG